MSALTQAEREAFTRQHEIGGELQLETVEEQGPKRQRTASTEENKKQKVTRSADELLAATYETKTLENVLDHNVENRKLHIQWSDCAPTWVDPVDSVLGLVASSDCDMVLLYLRHQKDESNAMKEWVEEIEHHRFFCAAQEGEVNRNPEPHEYGFCCSTCKCPENEKRTVSIFF